MVIIQFTRFHRQPGEQRQRRQQQPSPSYLPQVNWSPHLVLPSLSAGKNAKPAVGRESLTAGFAF
jgi:hypothetical protein